MIDYSQLARVSLWLFGAQYGERDRRRASRRIALIGLWAMRAALIPPPYGPIS